MKPSPRISVIIPVYNAERYLREAVASVCAQTFTDWEIIIVDDGSTDGSAALAAEIAREVPNVRVFQQSNAGPAAARNAGIAEARGEFIACLDADDLYPPDKFALQVARFERDPALEWVMGRIQYVWLPGGEPIHMRFREPDNTLVHVHLGSSLFRRAVFERVGAFDSTMRYGEDLDWFFRALEIGVKVRIIPATTLHYRLHAGNMTRGKTLREINAFRALKKSLDRRRQTGKIYPLPRWSDFDDAEALNESEVDHG